MTIEQSIIEIMQHIKVLNDDYTKLSVDVAILRTQMDAILKIGWIFVVAIIGSFITQIWQLIIMNRNGKK